MSLPPRARRPPRAWIGPIRPVDPAELLGPRGLTEEASQLMQAANRYMDQLNTSMSEITQASEETSKVVKTIQVAPVVWTEFLNR